MLRTANKIVYTLAKLDYRLGWVLAVSVGFLLFCVEMGWLS